MLDIALWEIKKASSPKIIAFVGVFLACIIAIALLYNPDASSGYILREFYSVGIQDTPELRELAEGLSSCPSLKVFLTDSQDNMDVYFSYNGKVSVYLPGDAKSLIAYSYVKSTVDELARAYFDSLDENISNPVRVNLVEVGGSSPEAQESLSVAPQDIPEFKPFETTFRIILFILPSILMSSLFGLSLMSEKIGKRIENLLTIPKSPFKILFGKMLPYLAISAAFSVFLSAMATSSFLLMSLVLFLVNLCFFSIASLVSIISRSFKEFSFLSTFSYFTFFFLLVFPNVMHGINPSASLSPLSAINDIMFHNEMDMLSLLFSFLPFAWLTASLSILSCALFEDEFLTSKKGVFWALKMAFEKLEKRRWYPAIAVFILVPVVYFAEIVLSILVSLVPFRFGPYLVLVLFALIEECSKQASVRGKRIYVPLLVGALFFAFEKSINLYLFLNALELVSIYSRALSNIWLTLGMHILTSLALFAFRKRRKLGLLIATASHALFNFYIGGLIV